MSWTDQVGGGTIQPANVSYADYTTATASLQLYWPLETAPSTNVVARVNDVTFPTTGFTVTVDDATQIADGYQFAFNNLGTDAFTVLDAAGGTIMTATAGSVWIAYLTDNTTASGAYQAFQMGAGSSSANAAALAGYGIKAITTTLNQQYIAVSYATNPTMGTTNRAELAVWTGGAGTVTLDSAATLTDGWFYQQANQGTGAINVIPSGGETINGASSFLFNPQDSAAIITDGTSFYTVGFGQSAVFAFDYTEIDVSGAGDYTLSGNELNRIAYKFTGTITGARYIVVPATKQQYWVTNAASGSFTFGVRTAAQANPGIVVVENAAEIMYCNGTDVVNADTQGVASPLPISMGGTSASTAAGARTNLDVPSNSEAILYSIVFGGGYT